MDQSSKTMKKFYKGVDHEDPGASRRLEDVDGDEASEIARKCQQYASDLADKDREQLQEIYYAIGQSIERQLVLQGEYWGPGEP
jgi:Skp family chaperone for outer membrane proteins